MLIYLQIPVGHVPCYETGAQRQHLPPVPLAGSWVSGHEEGDEEAPRRVPNASGTTYDTAPSRTRLLKALKLCPLQQHGKLAKQIVQ